EPTIALPMPPPSPTGRGLSNRKRRLSAPIPRIAIYERMIRRIPTAPNVQSAVSVVINCLAVRRVRSVPEKLMTVPPSPAGGGRDGDEGIVAYFSLSPHPNPLPTGEGNALC